MVGAARRQSHATRRPGLEPGLDRAQNPRQLLDSNFDAVAERIPVEPSHPKDMLDRGLDRLKFALVRAGARIATRALASQFHEPATHRALEPDFCLAFTKICTREKHNNWERPSAKKNLNCADNKK